MRLVKLVLLTGLLCAALSAGAPAKQTKDNKAEVALQAAIKTETVDGNLKGAIEQYKTIAALPGAGRVTVATALLRIGQCYEKLGNTEARAAYERLVRDYADQAGIVAQARVRLAALGGSGGAGGLVTRRILEDASEVDGPLSKDGKYISHMDWNTGDIVRYEVSRGQTSRISNKGGPEAKEGPNEYSAFSNDGKQIAYDSYSKDGVPQLKIRNLDGTDLRVLYGEKNFDARPLDWSLDSKLILAFRELGNKPNGGIDLVWISTANGSVRVLKEIASSWTSADVSPDGRLIAFGYMEEGTPPQSDLHVMSAEGGNEVVVAGHPAEDELIGWTPDGRSLIFLSDRSGTWDIWRVFIAGGKQQGEPEPLKKDFGRDPSVVGLAPDGSLYYETATPIGHLYNGELDLETGKLLTPPKPVMTRYTGLTAQLSWSPDGRNLAYLSRPGEIRPGNQILTIRSAETGEERFLSPRLRGVNQISWAPDSRAIIALGFTVTGYGAFRIDIETSAITKLAEQGVFARLCPDGKTLVFFDGEGTIRKRDLGTGDESKVWAGNPSYDISPDGREGVFQADGVVKIASLNGGETREIFRGKSGSFFGLMWTRDGRNIIVRGRGTENNEIWRVPAQGGTPFKLDISFPRMINFALHPNNRRFVFSDSEKIKSELWVLENLLPPTKAAK